MPVSAPAVSLSLEAGSEVAVPRLALKPSENCTRASEDSGGTKIPDWLPLVRFASCSRQERLLETPINIASCAAYSPRAYSGRHIKRRNLLTIHQIVPLVKAKR